MFVLVEVNWNDTGTSCGKELSVRGFKETRIIVLSFTEKFLGPGIWDWLRQNTNDRLVRFGSGMVACL